MNANDERPRCRQVRPHEVRTVKVLNGKPAASIRVARLCGYLLDRTGRCWFCGHVDREVRRQSRQSAIARLQTPDTKGHDHAR